METGYNKGSILTSGLGALALALCVALVVPACSGESWAPPSGVTSSAPSPSDIDAAVPSETDAAPTPAPAPGSLRVTVGAALRTAEDGSRATFTIALGSRPSLPVIVPLASSDEAEAKVEPSALTFTPDDWDRPKTATVIGQDDEVADGDRGVTISAGPTSSADATYNGLRAAPIAVTNADDDSVGIEVSTPSPSASTTEVGAQVRFTVRLRSRPAGDVTIGVASSRPSEGTPDAAQLVFTTATWSQPQTVTVTGKDDDAADGDQPYAITLIKAQSLDPAYAAIDPPDIALVNQDDDTAGFFVSAPAPPAQTTEAGGAVTFTVRLRSRPAADVTIPVSSTRSSEGVPSVTELTFTSLSYAEPQTVTVTGKDDAVDDDDQPYEIVLGAATSPDAVYAGLDPPDVALTNKDDDEAAIIVSAPQPAALTTEAGGTTKFSVRLASQPTADVTIGLSSTRSTEGQADLAQLVFTAATWNAPQTVTVTGQDDAVADGSVVYSIVLAKAISADAKYAAVDPADVALTNVDDDAAGIAVGAPLPGSQTTEGGAKVTVAVVLQSQPTASVTIPVSVTGPSEATVDVTELVFTAADWNVARTITVTGKDDAVDDGDQGYALVLGQAASADGIYAAIDPADVLLTNADDDTAAIAVGAPAPSNQTTEGGAKVTVTVVLKTEPTASVTVPVSVSKPAEATVDVAQLVFTAADWNVAQTITVTGKDDAVDDGDQGYALVLGQAASADAIYAAIDPADPALVNLDDDAAPDPVLVKFAVVGDYGSGSARELLVANMIAAWSPDFIVTTGDNDYATPIHAYDDNVGQFYHSFIAPYAGVYGAGAAANAFFPTMGNHDWDLDSGAAYAAFFTLPGNERYYELDKGPVHLILLDSDPREPAGTTAGSMQGLWAQAAFAGSAAPFQFVVFHHAAYTSGTPSPWMDWPFKAWGADAVFTGHVHTYERLRSLAGLQYFVNGQGGDSTHSFGAIHPGSELRYNAKDGAQLVEVGLTHARFRYYDVDGGLRDDITIDPAGNRLP